MFIYQKNTTNIELFWFADPDDPQSKIISRHVALESDDIEGDIKTFTENGWQIAIPLKNGKIVKRRVFLQKGEAAIELLEI